MKRGEAVQGAAVAAFGALAQSTRLGIVRLLVRAGPAGLAAGQIAHDLNAPASTLSTHLAILTRAALITAERRGRQINYAVDFSGLSGVLAYLIEDCCQGRPELCAPLAKVVERASACCPATTN